MPLPYYVSKKQAGDRMSIRKPTRIPGYDYSTPNYYFVTICTDKKVCLFGNSEKLNEFGKIAERCLCAVPHHFPLARIDKYVIMPNHVHAIVVIESGKDTPSLNTVIGSYKSAVSKQCHEINVDIKVWQRSYHDHIIRDQKRYELIWSYIDTNWYRWKDDKFYVE